jgi:hypothetical protein
LEIFVNQAWIPAGAQLTGDTADASRLAGEDSLARADLSRALPSMVGADLREPSGVNEVAPGVLHLAVPYDERVELTVDGTSVEARPGFGVTTAFDITQAGTGVLAYRDDGNRAWWRVAQTILWLAVLVVAAGARSPFGRRRSAEVHDETLIDLSEPASGVIAGEALAAPVWRDDPQFEIDADAISSPAPPSPAAPPHPAPDPDDAGTSPARRHRHLEHPIATGHGRDDDEVDDDGRDDDEVDDDEVDLAGVSSSIAWVST